ncbi:hypothetical protein P280DRAFT_522688 [Massarina eburnea CBS 473.64]|uniref:BTB domain-containing protein n=1 Tax=Massarina eburnea CBS 473.64 TaxID=1395130 RepID=A0A6A6RKP5_9PLEO|nr:hypothetical protein P280DRAFT_522688 [Massarina eburnea CBS 473.64]
MTVNTRTVVIDPRGDMVIELTNPITSFQCADESTKSSSEITNFLISHRALALTSKFFENLFRNEFERSIIDEDGMYHAKVQNINPVALDIVLNIAHGQFKKVPKELPSLEVFVQIASVVDRYIMHDIGDLYVPIWIKHAVKSVKRQNTFYAKEDAMFLFIAKVFCDSRLLHDTCLKLMMRAWGLCQDFRLPGRFDASHVDAIISLTNPLRSVLQDLEDKKNPNLYNGPLAHRAAVVGWITLILAENQPATTSNVAFCPPSVFRGTDFETIYSTIKELSNKKVSTGTPESGDGGNTAQGFLDDLARCAKDIFIEAQLRL